MQVPCGRCAGCRTAKAQEWALRCMHELNYHDSSCFVTLTYNDDHLPRDWSLNKEHGQKFMKRLRRRISHKKISALFAGEYGQNQNPMSLDTLGRPHYHALIYGFDFPDKEPYQQTESGEILHRSELLEDLWEYGFSSIGEITLASAAYVARYCMKKISGPDADQHYSWVDPTTGEITNRHPEYMSVSRRPALGRQWFEDFYRDCRKGYITHDGRRYPVPKYYLKLMEDQQFHDFEQIKEEARGQRDLADLENAPDRLRVKEKVHKLRTKSLQRNL